MNKIKARRCSKDCEPLCDFCCHFQMFKNRNGGNIDGSGYCGLHRKETDASSDCKDFYCETRWKKDIQNIGADCGKP